MQVWMGIAMGADQGEVEVEEVEEEIFQNISIRLK